MRTQRLSTRIPFRKRIEYGLRDPNSVGYTFNLSEKGIGIKGNRVFSPQSNIVMQIYVSGNDLEECSMDEIIRVKGTVAWKSPALPGMLQAMGIKLSSQSDELKNHLPTKNKPISATSFE